MKKLLLALLIVGGTMTTGCYFPGTPGYSGGSPTIIVPPTRQTGEMANRIIRNWNYDNQQIWDDVYDLLLLDPASHMTRWNVR